MDDLFDILIQSGGKPRPQLPALPLVTEQQACDIV